MSSDEEAVHLVILLHVIKNQKKHKSCSHWIKPWLTKRFSFGVYNTLIQELRSGDEGEYKKFLNMPSDVFDELLNLIEEHVIPQVCDTIFKKLKSTYMKVLYFVLFEETVLLPFLTSSISF